MSSIVSFISALNNSKFFAAITMLVLNVGTKYLALDISESQEEFLKHILVRRFALFTVFL